MELINHSSVTMGIIIVIDQSYVTMGEIYGIILEGLTSIKLLESEYMFTRVH